MCSECSDWQNKNTAKCRPCQAKGAFRVRLFRAFITVHFFLRVRGKIHLLLGCRWDRVAYAYAKLFFRAGKRTLGLWVAACRDPTTAATLSQRSPFNIIAPSPFILPTSSAEMRCCSRLGRERLGCRGGRATTLGGAEREPAGKGSGQPLCQSCERGVAG